MKSLILSACLVCLITISGIAALKEGEKAPDFSAKASLAGKEFDFSLNTALKKGPVVVFFYPAAFTGGCNLEAHTFAENKEKFDALGTSIIGVSRDGIKKLNAFSADPQYCAGKIAVASDPDANIARSYSLVQKDRRPGLKDTRGEEIDHEFTERVTFVITPDHKVVGTFSSDADKISPAEHVAKSLALVTQLKSSK